MGAAGVILKSVQPGERPFAPRRHTVVVLLPRVREDVVTQGSRLSEPLPTELALKGLLPRVPAHVVAQMARYI